MNQMRLQAVLVPLLSGFLFAATTFGQGHQVKGIWKGVFPSPAGDIELYWRIDYVSPDSLVVLHDCPVFGVKDVPAPSSRMDRDRLLLTVDRFPATFSGIFTSDPDSIAGWYKGEGVGRPLSIRRISPDPSALLPFMAPRMDEGGRRVTSWEYSIPDTKEEDWLTGDAEKSGLDMDLLGEFMAKVLRERYPNLHSILIARGDTLIFEEYFYNHKLDSPHPIYSNNKGIVSLGVGIAIEEGRIAGISAPVREFFPEFSAVFEGNLQREPTLENFLTMTAGYDWNETSTSYYDPNNTNRQMMNSHNFVEFVLKRPVVHPPGEHFTYNSGLPVVLSEVVRRATGVPFWNYVVPRVFTPLGFENYLCEGNRDGTAGGLLLRPRDFLKIARLYLDSGRWEGVQLIPEGWLSRSTLPEWAPERPPYWNHWGRSTIFLDGLPVTQYSGGGFGGQAIFGYPDLDLVVAFTAGNYSTPSVIYDDILTRYVLPPLLNNNTGYAPPVRIPKAALEGYEYRETFFTGLACLWSALGQLGEDVSEAWVYGLTGTAFALNANEPMWPNCSGRWNNPKLSEHLALLGFRHRTWSAYHLEPSFAETRQEAWSAIRSAIDEGHPAWGFHMHLPESYIVYGYDELGYYFKGVDCPQGFGPRTWESLASGDPGWFEMHSMAPAGQPEVREAVFAALQYAMEMHHSPETFRHQGFVFGPEAYKQWQWTLSGGAADWMGIAYNAAAWSVARRNASIFLGEVKELVPAVCKEALQLAEAEYETVAKCWEKVSELFPYAGTERWERIANWQDAGKREQAGELLQSAYKAEMNGMKWIEKALQLWTGETLSLQGENKERKPNIIIILADDYGYGDVGCYGSERFQTPHLDALAAGGLRFTDFHSNGAVCSPTRAALLTGRYQQRTGIHGVVTAARHRHTGLDLEEISFAEVLKSEGYSTALFGKWHLGYLPEYNPVRQGFDEFRGYVSGNVDYHAHLDQTGMEDWWKQDQLDPECGYTTDLITDHGVEFIKRHQNKPFVLYLAHEAPHYPYQGRHDPPRYTREHGRTTDSATIEVYREMIEVMDEGVGRIHQAVVDAGLMENTFIFFFSDNGPSGPGSAGPLRGKKGEIWEGGHRVPAIAFWPGKIEAGRVSDLPAMGADLLPTLGAIGGTALPDHLPLDGINLLPHLIENKLPAPRPLFWWHQDQLAIRQGDFKLISDTSFSKTSLYNLKDDLREEKDIAAEYPDLVKELLILLKEWQKDVTANVNNRT